MPKFLQSHAHLLGKGKGEDEPALESALSSKRPRDSDDSDGEEDDDKVQRMHGHACGCVDVCLGGHDADAVHGVGGSGARGGREPLLGAAVPRAGVRGGQGGGCEGKGERKCCVCGQAVNTQSLANVLALVWSLACSVNSPCGLGTRTQRPASPSALRSTHRTRSITATARRRSRRCGGMRRPWLTASAQWR